MQTHLLVVDDDERIRLLLQKYLIRNDYLVSIARDAAHARRLLKSLEFEMIILDVMMPGEDGIQLTHDLRQKTNVPILLLTAKNEIEDRISGLEAGADDYLAKPFEPKELLLRINSILRRIPDKKEEKYLPKIINLGPTRYDLEQGELWQGEFQIRLTATESQLMRIFAASAGEPVSRAHLVSQMGRGADLAQDRAIDVQITRLRKKIEVNPKEPRYLQTVRGSGYMLAPD